MCSPRAKNNFNSHYYLILLIHNRFDGGGVEEYSAVENGLTVALQVMLNDMLANLL